MAASTAAVDGGGLRLSTAPFLAFMAGGGRRQWTMAVMGVGGGSNLFHLFFTLLLLLALLYFIVGEAREIWEHFQ